MPNNSTAGGDSKGASIRKKALDLASSLVPRESCIGFRKSKCFYDDNQLEIFFGSSLTLVEKVFGQNNLET